MKNEFDELWNSFPSQFQSLDVWLWVQIEKHHRKGEPVPYARVAVYSRGGIHKAFDHESPTEALKLFCEWYQGNDWIDKGE